MHRGVAVVALALALPARCEALLGSARARGSEGELTASSGSPSSSGSPTPTAPPIWAPPESAAPVLSPSADPEPARPPSPELRKALAAFERGDHKKVRALLEKKVRAGKGAAEENQLVAASCAALVDKACVEALRPLVRRE